jgi:hypothetical protein
VRNLARGSLAIVAIAQAELGVWGIASPRSLYDQYPGFGRHWISALGPYNEHLIRDFAAAGLGMAVLLLCAAVWFERRLVLVAGAAFLTATLPHFAYHLTTTDSFSTADNAVSLGGFALELAVVIAAMGAVQRPDPKGDPNAPTATGRTAGARPVPAPDV